MDTQEDTRFPARWLDSVKKIIFDALEWMSAEVELLRLQEANVREDRDNMVQELQDLRDQLCEQQEEIRLLREGGDA